MGRTLLAVIGGLVAMVACVAAVELLSAWLYPPPPGVDYHDPAQLRAAMPTIPWQAKALVILAWTLGSLVGAYVAAKIARSMRRAAALAIGCLMMTLVGISLVMIPHPAWMIALGLLLPLPFALLGRELAD